MDGREDNISNYFSAEPILVHLNPHYIELSFSSYTLCMIMAQVVENLNFHVCICYRCLQRSFGEIRGRFKVLDVICAVGYKFVG